MSQDKVPEIIDSGPLCITHLFQQFKKKIGHENIKKLTSKVAYL